VISAWLTPNEDVITLPIAERSESQRAWGAVTDLAVGDQRPTLSRHVETLLGPEARGLGVADAVKGDDADLRGAGLDDVH
jgi:hypothetical protein